MKRQRLCGMAAVFCAICLVCVASCAQEIKGDAQAATKSKAAQLFELGGSYSAEKKYDQAIEAYRELLKLEPNHAFAYHNLGVALGRTQRRQEALEAFRMAVKLAPTQPHFQESLGSAYMNVGRWDESLAALNESIRLDPNRPSVYNTLGFLFDNTRRFDDAVAANKKAIELAPDNPANYHNLGLMYIKMGRAADAIEPLEKALKLSPSYKNARYHLSNALSKLRRYKEAVDSYTKLLELDPDQDELLTLRAWNYMYLGGSGREAADDAERYLKLYGWRTQPAPYHVLIAIIGNRSSGSEERAAAVISQAQKKMDPAAWGFKIVRFLDGQVTADELLTMAANNDQRTEAHAYIGMDMRLKNKPAEAKAHFEWVKEYGTRTFTEYALSLAELERSR